MIAKQGHVQIVHLDSDCTDSSIFEPDVGRDIGQRITITDHCSERHIRDSIPYAYRGPSPISYNAEKQTIYE